jgi:putative transposase
MAQGDLTVKKSKFSEAQIVAALKELDGGTPATTLGRRLGVHPNTIRQWRDRYAGLETSDLVRLKPLELENAQMRRSSPAKSSNSMPFGS